MKKFSFSIIYSLKLSQFIKIQYIFFDAEKIVGSNGFTKKNSNLRKFEKILNQNHKFTGFGNYNKLLKWSIKNPNLFWSAIWDFSEIKGTKSTKFKKIKNL